MAAGRVIKLGAGALAALALGGCGHTVRVPPHRLLRLAVSEYRFNPDDVIAPPGALTIAIHNFGRLTHNLVISQNGRIASTTAPIAPGDSTRVRVKLKPGTYLIYSSILQDQALGAYGQLRIGR